MGWFKKREPLYVPPVEDFVEYIREEEETNSLSATEHEAIQEWYAASSGSITDKELGEWMRYAKQFKWTSPARRIIEEGVAEYRRQYPFR
jgi:hypothetical protein